MPLLFPLFGYLPYIFKLWVRTPYVVCWFRELSYILWGSTSTLQARIASQIRRKCLLSFGAILELLIGYSVRPAASGRWPKTSESTVFLCWLQYEVPNRSDVMSDNMIVNKRKSVDGSVGRWAWKANLHPE